MILVLSFEELELSCLGVETCDFIVELRSFLWLVAGNASERVDVVQTLFLRSRVVVLHEVLMSREDARRLHGSSSLGAKYALHLEPSFKIEGQTVVADPVNLRNLIDAIAFLVDWDVAVATEDN